MEKGNLELDLDGPAIHLSLSYDNGSNIFLHMIVSNTELTKVCAGCKLELMFGNCTIISCYFI